MFSISQIYKQSINQQSQLRTKNKAMNSVQRRTAGMIGKGTETFAIGNEPFTIYEMKIYPFESTPKSRIALYREHMQSNPKGEKAMEGLTKSRDLLAKTKQWMVCRFGGMDNTPDIDENNRIQEAEYVPCAKRGSCLFEGIGCCTIEVSKGVFLSKSELAVVRLINLPDKNIADELFICTETVKTHIQNIRKKIDRPSKIEVAIWATIKGII